MQWRMPTVVPDPPQAGVKVTLGAGKLRLEWNFGIVAERATKRAIVGRKGPIWTKLDRAGKTQGNKESECWKKRADSDKA